MSELKHQLMLNKERSWVPCYLKSEADKVIAEKDAEITGLRDECAELHNRIATLLSQLRIREERIDELKAELEEAR